MPNPETIRRQQSLLATYRRTLAIQLRQLASLGADHAPPGIHNGIAEGRTQIRQIKATLRNWGVVVEDEDADAELPDSSGYAPPILAPARADLAIVTAMPEELEPVLDLIGGRDRWESFTLDKYIHHRASFAFGDTQLNVVACSLWNYGGNPTTAALLRLKPLRPRMIAMTGICAGWDAQGVHLGDVVVADRAFRTREGKLMPDGFHADTQTYQPPPWLMSWLRGFAADKQWFSGITTSRPHSLRYQAEWLLCRISERKGAAYPATEADWDEVSASEIDIAQSHDLLVRRELIFDDGMLTAAGQNQITALYQKHRGKLLPTPDPQQPAVHYGAFASSEAVIVQTDPFGEYAQRVRKVRAIDLEVASLFAAAAEIEVPAFAVKGVSDYGTTEKDDAFHAYAAEAAARWTYAFVRAHAAALLDVTEEPRG
jgi:nucleoside phosphorylase